MPNTTDQLSFLNNEDSAKRKPLTALETQQQKQAKLNDATAASINKLEKSIARAYYVVGELVLQNPDVLALIHAHLDSRLDKQSFAYKVVHDYAANVTQVAGLKELLRR